MDMNDLYYNTKKPLVSTPTYRVVRRAFSAHKSLAILGADGEAYESLAAPRWLKVCYFFGVLGLAAAVVALITHLPLSDNVQSTLIGPFLVVFLFMAAPGCWVATMDSEGFDLAIREQWNVPGFTAGDPLTAKHARLQRSLLYRLGRRLASQRQKHILCKIQRNIVRSIEAESQEAADQRVVGKRA